MDALLLGVAMVVFAAALVSGRLERSIITLPIVVVVIGVAAGEIFDLSIGLGHEVVVFLELTLALVLFSDASRIDLVTLRRQEAWPRRMLTAGLPLAIAIGALVSWIGLGTDPGWALLVGVILAPTDAALAAPVLVTKELPVRVRQSLNVESGLNDGLALPALFVALALIEAEEGISAAAFIRLFTVQLGLGIAFGIGFGLLGGWLVARAIRAGWMGGAYTKIATLALALATFGATQWAGASGFVAAFVAGMVFSTLCRNAEQELFEFAEDESSTLVLVAFLFLGIGPLRNLIENPPGWEAWVVAILSLVLVRPIAILISMLGSQALMATRMFFGWFGPRGLATVVFLLTAIEEAGEVPDIVVQTVMLTVGLSVLLHGLTAYPASMGLARSLARRPDTEPTRMPEMAEMQELPMRVFGFRSGRS